MAANDALVTTSPVPKFTFSHRREAAPATGDQAAPIVPPVIPSQTTQAETKPETKTVELTPTESASKSWQKKLSLEQKAAKERADRKAEKEAIASEKASLAAEKAEWTKINDLKTRAKTDHKARMELLKMTGMTYDDVLEAQLADGGAEPSPEDAKLAELENRFKSLEEQTKEEKRLAAETQKATLEAKAKAVIADFHAGVEDAVNSSEAFPLTKALGRAADVHALMDQVFASPAKRIMSVEEAGAVIEAAIAEELPKTIESYIAIPAVRSQIEALLSRVQSPQAGTKSPVTTPKPKESDGTEKKNPFVGNRTGFKKTITNDMTAKTPEKRPSSWEEIRARRLAAGG